MDADPQRHHEPLLTTSPGTRSGAFGPADWGLFAALAVLWGSAYLFIDIALASVAPELITWVRLALGAAVLVVVPSARRGRIAREDRPRLVLLATVWLAVPLTLIPVAQQWVDSSVTGTLTGAQPLMVAVLAAVLLRRRPGALQVVGLAVGFAGVVAVAYAGTRDAHQTAPLGVALILSSVACYAVGATIAVPLQQRYGSTAVTLRALAVATVLATPLAAASLVREGVPDPDASAVVALVVLGVLSTGAGFVAYATLAGRAGATRAASTIYAVPVVALVLGVTVAGDPLRPLAVVGAALVIVGALLTSRADRGPGAAPGQRSGHSGRIRS